MTSLIKPYFAALISFLVIDAVWIGLFVRQYYEAEVGELMRTSPNAAAAGLFYLFYAAGIVMLAISPAINAASLKKALINGASLGALSYGTYTVTNYAVIEGWTLGLVGSDMGWGAFLTAAAAGAGYWAASR